MKQVRLLTCLPLLSAVLCCLLLQWWLFKRRATITFPPHLRTTTIKSHNTSQRVHEMYEYIYRGRAQGLSSPNSFPFPICALFYEENLCLWVESFQAASSQIPHKIVFPLSGIKQRCIYNKLLRSLSHKSSLGANSTNHAFRRQIFLVLAWWLMRKNISWSSNTYKWKQSIK